MKHSISFYTLGCKVNQSDTASMEKLFREAGYEIVPFGEASDICLINTCVVTNMGQGKSRRMIRRTIKRDPKPLIVVTGCYPQTAPEEVAALEGVDLLVGNRDRARIVELVEERLGERDAAPVNDVLDLPVGSEFEDLAASVDDSRDRAFLKIQEGCDQYCSYCIIPYARGPVRSLPKAEAVAQTEHLRQEGYRELVFTGIEISSWGRDLKNGESLIDLLEAVSAAAGDMRLRLGSLEPRTITEDFCRRAAALPHLCPHFHLSLQSGCDATLKRMNRKYDTARFRESVRLLNRYFHRPAITTDLICGFPEETEEEFGQTLAFIEECGFAAMHIFPYSIRPGTKAAAMEQVPPTVKEQRTARAGQVAERMHRAYLEGCVGQVYPVLFEQARDGLYTGHAPNYMEVGVAADGLHNVILDVKITGIDGEMLRGELT